jgi:hypothetical protein
MMTTAARIASRKTGKLMASTMSPDDAPSLSAVWTLECGIAMCAGRDGAIARRERRMAVVSESEGSRKRQGGFDRFLERECQQEVDILPSPYVGDLPLICISIAGLADPCMKAQDRRCRFKQYQ